MKKTQKKLKRGVDFIKINDTIKIKIGNQMGLGSELDR